MAWRYVERLPTDGAKSTYFYAEVDLPAGHTGTAHIDVGCFQNTGEVRVAAEKCSENGIDPVPQTPRKMTESRKGKSHRIAERQILHHSLFINEKQKGWNQLNHATFVDSREFKIPGYKSS